MRRLVFPALVLAALAGTAGNARAHALLKAASPAVGSTVASAPSEIALDFTESVEPAFSRIEVLDAAGADMRAGATHVVPGQPARLAVAVKALPAGAYKVIWHVTSTDTHKTQGGYGFTVAP